MQENNHYEDHKHHASGSVCQWCYFHHRNSRWVTAACFAIGFLFLLAVFGFRNLLELGLAIFFVSWGLMRLRPSKFLRRNVPKD